MCRLQTHIWKRVAVNATNCLLSACFNNQLQDDDVIIDAKSCQVGLRPLLLVRYIGPFRLQDWRYSRAQHLYHWLIAAFEFGFPLPTSLGSNYHIEPPISSCHHYFWPSLILTVSRASPLVILSIIFIWILIAEQKKKKKEERRCLAFTSPQTSALMELMLIPFSLMPPELLLRLSEDLNTYVNLLFSFLHSFWILFFFNFHV